VISRNNLTALMVLLAGLSTGYFASRALASLDELPREELFSGASVLHLGSMYKHSKDHFDEVLEQAPFVIREAAGQREVDMLRLQDYYTHFFMHYYRWLSTGNDRSGVQYKLALGQYKATLIYLKEKYRENPCFSPGQLEELQRVSLIAERTDRSIRFARVVLVLLLFILVMGIPRLIRDVGFKKFAGALYFDALFRPNRISDLNWWHSLYRVAAVLLGIYLFSLVIITSFVSWRIPLILGVLGLIPLFTLLVISGAPGKLPEMLVSFLAPKMLLLIVALGVVAVRGPNLLFSWIIVSGTPQRILLPILGMLLFRKLHLNMILARKWSHRSRRGASAMSGMAWGFQLLAAGGLLYLFGPRKSLEILNRELLLIPPQLIGSPGGILGSLMVFAGVLSLASLLIFLYNRTKSI